MTSVAPLVKWCGKTIYKRFTLQHKNFQPITIIVMKTFILGLLVSFNLCAQSILVSDVDDTIKVSNVLDKDSTAANLPMLRNAFIGMPELYHAIADINGMKAVKYLSNAPRRVIGKVHERFLVANNFPKGELVARSFYDLRSGNKHKIESIRKFIAVYKPKEMILIGDNGEADAVVYSTITNQYTGVPALTYIRQAYSNIGFNGNFAKPLLEGQIPFATSLDISLDLYKRGVFSVATMIELVNQIAPAIIEEADDEERGKQMAFPEWYDCRDFTLPELPVLPDYSANDLLQKYGTKVLNRCNQLPFGN